MLVPSLVLDVRSLRVRLLGQEIMGICQEQLAFPVDEDGFRIATQLLIR